MNRNAMMLLLCAIVLGAMWFILRRFFRKLNLIEEKRWGGKKTRE